MLIDKLKHKVIFCNDYEKLVNGKLEDMLYKNESIYIFDNLYGFDSNLRNPILDYLKKIKFEKDIFIEYLITSDLEHYNSLNIHTSIQMLDECNYSWLEGYNIHPEIDYKHFICTFNRGKRIGREIITGVLKKFRLFNPDTCTKLFTSDVNYKDTFLSSYEKYLTDDEVFLSDYYTIKNDKNALVDLNLLHGEKIRNNIYELEKTLTTSFLHLVSESYSHSYYPFITEKFLYSIVTRGLFLTYGQPNWHKFIEKYYGFKLFDIFDYSFDSINDPLERSVMLLSEINKFARLSIDDWKDLYEMEKEIVEFNYDHYMSKGYLETLKKRV